MALQTAQLSANALATYLTSALTECNVLARWPSNSVQLANRTVSITKVGARRRLDVNIPLDPIGRVNASATTANVTFPIGTLIQPIQIDVWCTSDGDRDDVLSQLDDALTAGVNETVDPSFTDDPVKDGIVLAISAPNEPTQYIDCWFDEPEIFDDPSNIQRAEYRATIAGDIRATLSRTVTVPRMVTLKAKVKSSEQSPPPAGQLYDTATITTSGVTYGQSS